MSMENNLCVFVSSIDYDITEYDELCWECKKEEDDYEYFCYFERKPCTCSDIRKYETRRVRVCVDDNKKLPSECVYNIRIRVIEKEQIKSETSFSIFQNMDSNNYEMKDIAIENSHDIIGCNHINKYKFKGVKPYSSYVDFFFYLYKKICDSKEIVEEKKINPHMKEKRKK